MKKLRIKRELSVCRTKFPAVKNSTRRVVTSLCTILFFMYSLSAQKKAVTSDDFNTWVFPTLLKPMITNNGKYLTYCEFGNKGKCIIESVNKKWKISIAQNSNVFFSSDSKYAIYALKEDSVCIMKLGSPDCILLTDVNRFQVPKDTRNNLIVYSSKMEKGKIVIYDYLENRRTILNDVKTFYLSDSGESLLVEKDITSCGGGAVELIKLKEMQVKHISTIGNIENIIFDKAFRRIAFSKKVSCGGTSLYSIFYYEDGMDSAKVVAGNSESTFDIRITSHKPRFNLSGDKIFFLAFPNKGALDEVFSNKRSNIDVDVWNYKDASVDELVTSTLNNSEEVPFLYVYDILSAKICQLTKSGETTMGPQSEGDIESIILIRSSNGNRSELNWKMSSRITLYALSLKDGKRRLIKDQLWNDISFLSSDGQFVIYFDRSVGRYFSYSTLSEKNVEIGNNSDSFYDDEYDRADPPSAYGVAGWSVKDTTLLIYDRYDVWKVDPRGIKANVNLTNGYGKRNNTVFRLINFEGIYKYPIVNCDEDVVLMGFNRVNKDNGFYKTKFVLKKDPELLSMGPYVYHLPYINLSLINLSYVPVKAKNANVFVVRRMSEKDAPNFFVSNDLRNFKRISDIQPQKSYNWYTTELVKWKVHDSLMGEGILYKPENFDVRKRYPVIIYFYEKLSDGLHEFIYPETTGGPLNIPTYVSSEYLVFVPNIYYKIGDPGYSAYNCIVSAANYLSKFSWINSMKIGLQGHSFGGYQANFVLTRSNKFAAIASAAGATDLISLYGFDKYNCEIGQLRLGKTLWEARDSYIRNSPIFYVDSVVCPILIQHNRDDYRVPFQQGMEFFTALRRLGKSAWMLQYSGQQHGLVDEAAKDYEIKLKQYFDHFLKESNMPKWMTDVRVR